MGQNEVGQVGQGIDRAENPESGFGVLADLLKLLVGQWSHFFKNLVIDIDFADIMKQADDPQVIQIRVAHPQGLAEQDAQVADPVGVLAFAGMGFVQGLDDGLYPAVTNMGAFQKLVAVHMVLGMLQDFIDRTALFSLDIHTE